MTDILTAIEQSGAVRVHNIAKPETTTFTDAQLQVFVDLMCADLRANLASEQEAHGATITREAKLSLKCAKRDALLAEKDAVIDAMQTAVVIVTENHGGYRVVQCVVCGEHGWESQMTHKDDCAACYDIKTLPSEALERALIMARSDELINCHGMTEQQRTDRLKELRSLK